MIKTKDIQRIIVANETAQEASIEIKKMVDKYVEQQVKLFATPDVSKSLNYDWIKVTSENDLPTKGMLVLVCRDLGDTKQYYTTHWSNEDEKYWKLNDIVGWVKISDFII